MSFSATKAQCEPIYKKFQKFNCLFFHDQTYKLLPSSFENFFTSCVDLYDTCNRRIVGSLLTSHVTAVEIRKICVTGENKNSLA